MTFKDTKILSEHLVVDILSIANESIKKNSKFSIVLSGGNSFLDSYKILRSQILIGRNGIFILVMKDACL